MSGLSYVQGPFAAARHEDKVIALHRATAAKAIQAWCMRRGKPHSGASSLRMWCALQKMTCVGLHQGGDGYGPAAWADKAARISGKRQSPRALADLRRTRVNDLCEAGLAQRKHGLVRATLPGLQPLGQIRKFPYSVSPRKMQNSALKSTKRVARSNRGSLPGRARRCRNALGRFVPRLLSEGIDATTQQPAQPAPAPKLVPKPSPERAPTPVLEVADATVGSLKKSPEAKKPAVGRFSFQIPADVAAALAINPLGRDADEPPERAHTPTTQGRTKPVKKVDPGLLTPFNVNWINRTYGTRLTYFKLKSAGISDMILLDATHWAVRKHDAKPFDSLSGAIVHSAMRRKVGVWGSLKSPRAQRR